ncbi:MULTISPECIES: phage tail protein [unclassified Empedobacter]|uniref:phage tail protein n=1 Tax=unclassified Empedobacter TaxID=2643773 RepID=UPI0025C3C732|nr:MULTISPECIES: phage tail protein [unclassified Empedobacter]
MEQILVKRSDNSEYLLEDKNKGSFITSIIQSTELRSNDVINVEIISREFINFTIGDSFHYLGQKYTLNQIPRYFKNSSNDFQFSMTFEGAMFDLRRASYDVNIDTTGSAIYGETLTADLELFATILIENINRVFPGKWVLGEIPTETETKTITFSEEENCLAALQMLCDEYDTDFIIKTDNNGVNILNFKQVGNEIPLEFKVGFQKGLYTLTREKVDASDIVTRLKVYGSDKNLGTDYRANRLVLKDKNKSNSFIENAQAVAKYGIYESTKIFDDIYPRRKGKVTSINSESPYKFSDISMDFDLKERDENGTKYLLNGVNAKIHFNTGDLAGYELEIHDYNHETKEFHIVKFADENGYEFPSKDSDAFRIGIGDEYVILDIQMPQVYIDNAEAELFEKGTEHLSDKLEPNIQYLLDVDTLHLQRILNNTVTKFFSIGDFIKVVDEDFDINRYIRIKSIERDLRNPFDYKLTLSDSKVTNFLSGTIPGEINTIKNIIKINNLNNPAKARRNWKDAQEVLNMVFDVEGDYYTDKIKPNSIETTHLQVGAKSMQFNLIDSFFEPNFEGNPNKIRWSTCKLVHFTISDNIVEWQIQGGQKDLEANKPYYLYAKCNKSNNIGVIEITETQYVVDQGSSYYFLIGIVNTYSEDVKAREISLMYGFTTVSGRFIKTGRIESNDGSTYFDLDSGEFKGKFTFTNGKSVEEAITNQEIYIEYSQNGIDWHSTFLYDDVFMRQKKGDGAWSNTIRIVGIQGIKGDKGEDGQTQYVHIRYSANSDGSSMTTTPQANTAYIGIVTTTNSEAPTSNTSYTWAKFKGEDGVPGIPGADGKDGIQLYTWVKYATDANGSNMSDFPDGKTHIGLAYNKTTSIESNTASDYTWALIKGEQGNQGVPGVKGADGQQFYTWIKYATTPTSGMSDDPTGKLYMGIAYNKTIQTESSNYADYSWSLIKGEQGTQGVPGIPGADGSSLFTWVKYADTPTSGMSDYPDDKLYIGLAYNKVTATESDDYSDYSWSLMPQNIEIGGRNLLRDTGNKIDVSTPTNNYFLLTYALSSPLEIGKTYTISFKVKTFAGKTGQIWFRTNKDLPGSYDKTINFNTENIEQVKTHTEVFTASQNDANIVFYNFGYSSSSAQWLNNAFILYDLKLEKGNKATDWTPAPEDVEANILKSKTDSINASKAYSDAQDELKRIQTEAYADGKVTAAEQRAIDDATAKAEATKVYAAAQDNLLRTQLEAYADGQITAEEQQRIQQMQDNLAAAKAYADAQANLAKIASNAYADGIVDEEEARAIADATAKMEAAKQHAQGLVNNIQIGGRNLILNSQSVISSGNDHQNSNNSVKGEVQVHNTNNNWNSYAFFNQSTGFNLGDEVTFSIDLKVSYDAEVLLNYMPHYPNNIALGTFNLKANQWTRKSITLKILNNDGNAFLFGLGGNNTPNLIINYKNPKVEFGNKATDWTPAPEDVESSIEQAKQLAEQANQKVIDISNDNILSASEKQQISNEWNRIKSEYTSNYSLGISNGVSTTNLTNAYNDLFNYITPLLVDISVDSPIVGDVFRAKFKAYYDQNIALLVAINDKIKQGINNNANNINNLNSSIARINQITSFLNTTVNGNVIGTGVLMVGSESQSNAGISGLNEAGSKSVRLWAGGTAQNRDKAAWNTLDDGTMQFFHPNGNIAFRFGLSNGKFIMDGYHEQGMKLWELSPNRGLVNVAYIPESWTNTPMININQSSSTLDVASAKTAVVNRMSIVVVSNFRRYIASSNYTSFEYQNGTHPDNAQYANLIGYKTVNNSRTSNIPNGWYGLQVGEIDMDQEPSNGEIPPIKTIVYFLYYIENGKVTKNQSIQFTDRDIANK